MDMTQELGDDMKAVVQKSATVGDIIERYIKGISPLAIAEEFGLDVNKVGQLIHDAEAAGKFIPEGIEASIDKVTDTPKRKVPKPLVEGENPTMATTENAV